VSRKRNPSESENPFDGGSLPTVEVQVDAQFARQVDAADLRAAAVAALLSEGQAEGEMSVVVTDNALVQELNARYRGVDGVTDVLAFPSRRGEDPFVEGPEAANYLGDVIIACPRAAAQARDAGHSIADELRLLVVHGTLHLLGYDHATPDEERAMWARQEEILRGLSRELEGEGGLAKMLSGRRHIGPSISSAESPWRADLLTSFRYAFAGQWYVLRTQRNARIHLVIALLAVALAAVLRLSLVEWAILALTIGFVFVAEMFNTMAEAAVDAATQEFHPLAKIVKDVAAGAVLLSAIISVIVGLLLFGPRLWALWRVIR